MSAMFAAMMPHALNRAIAVFAWLAAPLWAGTVIADLAGLPNRGITLLTGAAVASTACALRVWHEGLVDARIRQGLVAAEQNQALMAAALELAAGKSLPLAPVPTQPDGGTAPVLRAVH